MTRPTCARPAAWKFGRVSADERELMVIVVCHFWQLTLRLKMSCRVRRKDPGDISNHDALCGLYFSSRRILAQTLLPRCYPMRVRTCLWRRVLRSWSTRSNKRGLTAPVAQKRGTER